ncbi:hemerythrin hhe cation binding subfamily protein [Acanthamoeba castellanii str. Neff]|uniref:Hemerythrin hhe cation binding subfamily protein n=1 Tax=Acanthamoeba castellanii (strain ATCC 30010 / Neff) TaxID=1257118 RepID=L8GKF7_ACACF|nr:hemerythrin hhe cation binding subfamily protein [Acanthamoeba castellanii str. Neff]ELR13324.1 hemerythrin hhe cation binding subfamily protein [Acanthamoeba castellanii str. Neff]
MPQWQWSHHWQRRERRLFLELCARALDRCEDTDGTLRPRVGDVKRLERGWRFIVENLDQHAEVEEELFFPALKKVIQDDEGQAIIDHLLSDHKDLEAKLHSIKKEKLEPLEGDERTKEGLQAFTDAVAELLEAYGEHINEEEEKVVPFVQRFMSEKAQKEVGQAIKSHHQKLPSGKYGLLMFRDVTAEIPEELALFNATFPWILRKVVIIPVMAATDGLYKEYKTIFYEPWL